MNALQLLTLSICQLRSPSVFNVFNFQLVYVDKRDVKTL